MNCEKTKSQLSAYIDGEVSERDAAFIMEHIAICSDCNQEEQSLRRTSQLLGYWEEVRAPDGFCEALLARVESAPSHTASKRLTLKLWRVIHAFRPLAGPRALIKVAAYGAAVLLLCVGVIFFTRLPLRRASMVEPLPIQTESAWHDTTLGSPSARNSEYNDLTTRSSKASEGSPRYTTMAEIKVAGIWE